MKLLLVVIMILHQSMLFGQPLGETFVAGTTWWDMQHFGSCGRMIAVDNEGLVHVSWRNALDSLFEERHTFYNLWSPGAHEFEYAEGLQLDTTYLGGYPTIGLANNSCPLVIYHNVRYDGPQEEVFMPVVNLCSGLNLRAYDPDPTGGLWIQGIGQPVAAIDILNRVHILTKAYQGTDGVSQVIHYSRLTTIQDSLGRIVDGSYDELASEYHSEVVDSPWNYEVGYTIASARHSLRIARAWLRCINYPFPDGCSNYSNDLMLDISDDGGMNWSAAINITNFDVWDAECPDTTQWRICDRDTLRCYWDICLLFDEQDELHISFTTRSAYYWEYGHPESPYYASIVWHWRESTGQFSTVAMDWDTADHIPYGSPGLAVHSSSLACEPGTNRLLCCYIQGDSTSPATRYTGNDIWVSVSTDNGNNWSVGTNVTRTRPTVIPAPFGQSLSEVVPTLAETIHDETIHLLYEIDREPGDSFRLGNAPTLNEVIYQRIPVDSIPTTPLIENYPLHWDSSGFYAAADDQRAPIPTEITLHAFPNPFNSTATIEYTLSRRTQLTITIYDLLGREIITLFSGTKNSGTHNITWNATASSGLYFATLKTSTNSTTQKLLLLR